MRQDKVGAGPGPVFGDQGRQDLVRRRPVGMGSLLRPGQGGSPVQPGRRRESRLPDGGRLQVSRQPQMPSH